MQIVREAVEFGEQLAVDPREGVVAEHRRHRDEQPEGGHQQRLSDRSGHLFDGDRAGSGDAGQRVIDPPDCAEQSHERRGGADRGEQRLPRFEPSPALRWHYDLVVRLLSEFYLGKWRAQELKRLSYIQAVYETGARLTHDVKNLLQSLDTLCAVANEAGVSPSPRFGELLRRQLPEISSRLRQTLDKLVEPGKRLPAAPMPADDWLASLEKRYADADTHVIAVGDLLTCHVEDPALFSSVAENLLQNINAKRLTQPGVQATLRLVCAQGGTVLEVSDDGRAIPAALADRLLKERVTSEDGLGIGLYQCARQAEEAGYRLELASNIDGCVSFRLARPDAQRVDSAGVTP